MQSTDLITPLAIGSPIALSGDKNIPSQTASGTDTSSISAGFLPITSQPLNDGGIAPERTDFNGMFYLATDQRFYLQNGGIITYDPNVVAQIGGYPQGAILGYIDSAGNLGFVKSLINNNAYNFVQTPSYINGQYWEYTYFSNFQLLENKISPIGHPKFTLDFDTLPTNCIWLEGAEVSRTTYANLFAIYGTDYGAGNGSTTFNLPDCRNRVFWGGTIAGYIAAGLPNITGTLHVDFRSGTSLQGYATGAFTTYDSSNAEWQGAGGSAWINNGSRFSFDASRSSSIYGGSNTVLPPAIKVRVYTRYQ